MTREQLDKLIEGGGWLPIEDATVGERGLQKHGDIMNIGRYSTDTPDFAKPDAVAPLDTIQEFAAEIKRLQSENNKLREANEVMKDYVEGRAWHPIAKEALAKVEEIMGVQDE